VPTDFSELPDWRTGDIGPAIEAFAKSCAVWAKKSPEDPISTRTDYGGKVTDWLPACTVLQKYRDVGELHRFFEDYFDVYSVETDEEINKLTGYYEPELEVSSNPTGDLISPIPLRPADLIEVKLGQFEKELENRTVWGRAENGKLVLYQDRETIEISPDRVLAYAHPTDVFFLQIQGSGRLKFPDGRLVRAGFDAHNHRPFGSLANHLMKTGEITRGEASMSGIRAWMDRVGLKRAREAMNVNPRFVFFRETPITDPAQGPDGAAGIPLTPMGSVAVDLSKHPLGLPVFIESNIPDESRKPEITSLLLIAQDTGGAIKGARRGDIFFGSGTAAGLRAGSMNAPGRFWVFLPQTVSHETSDEPAE
jgi:membrane-bound lytic murein transglycosylase A